MAAPLVIAPRPQARPKRQEHRDVSCPSLELHMSDDTFDLSPAEPLHPSRVNLWKLVDELRARGDPRAELIERMLIKDEVGRQDEVELAFFRTKDDTTGFAARGSGTGALWTALALGVGIGIGALLAGGGTDKKADDEEEEERGGRSKKRPPKKKK